MKKTCECCGNTYDKAFEVTMAGTGTSHTFDSFQCAIQMLAPRCSECACTIIGHGMEADGKFYCCAHCARKAGVQKVADRPPSDAQVHH
jgi:hypothetical protein